MPKLKANETRPV